MACDVDDCADMNSENSMEIHDSFLGERNPLATRNRLGYDRGARRDRDEMLRDRTSKMAGVTRSNNSIQHGSEAIDHVADDSSSETPTRRCYDEIIYDVASLILSCIYQIFMAAYKAGHGAFIKHTENIEEHLPAELKVEDTDKRDEPIKNDTEDSVIIVNVKNKNTNVFAPLLDFDIEEDNNTDDKQYGTSFSIAKYPKFTSSRSYTPIAFTDSQRTRPLDASSLSVLEPSKNSDYDSYVSKFYLPHEPIPKNKYSLVDSLIDNYFAEGISNIFKERKERQKLIAQEREKSKTKLTQLSKEQVQVVNKAWGQSPNSLISSAFQIEITTRDLQTLCDGHWLNDNVIDFYFNLITAKNTSVFGWTTHFFTTLKLKGYQGVARWSKRKKVNVTEKDLILVPINIMSTHWALAVVDNKNKRFQYYDSLSSNGNLQALQILQNYMTQEGKKHNSSTNFDEYLIEKNMPSPQQQNGYDCGVFTCICANYVSQGKELRYGQKDMKLIRRRMAYEIIMKDLLN